MKTNVKTHIRRKKHGRTIVHHHKRRIKNIRRAEVPDVTDPYIHIPKKQYFETRKNFKKFMIDLQGAIKDKEQGLKQEKDLVGMQIANNKELIKTWEKKMEEDQKLLAKNQEIFEKNEELVAMTPKFNPINIGVGSLPGGNRDPDLEEYMAELEKDL